jgi:hypothetical protein
VVQAISKLQAQSVRSRPGAGLSAADSFAIQSLVAAYSQLTDRPTSEPVADFFTDAGVLILGGLRLEGKGAISAFFIDRNHTQAENGRITRHIPGLVELRALDTGRVAGRSTVVVYAGAGVVPIASGPPSTICDFDDIYVRQPDGRWLFEQRRAAVIFTGAGAASFAK